MSASLGVSFGADGAGGVTAISYTGPALSSGTVPLVYTFDDATDTLTATAGARTVFTLVVDEVAGTWTFTLLDHLDHPLVSTEDNLVLSFNATVTDGDGDAVIQALSVNVDDDMPVATAGTVAQTVYEDLLAGGNPDTPANPAGASTIATGTLGGLVSFGADQPGTITLSTNTAGLPQNLTSIGAAVVYNVTGNLLTAFVDTGPAGLDGATARYSRCRSPTRRRARTRSRFWTSSTTGWARTTTTRR